MLFTCKKASSTLHSNVNKPYKFTYSTPNLEVHNGELTSLRGMGSAPTVSAPQQLSISPYNDIMCDEYELYRPPKVALWMWSVETHWRSVIGELLYTHLHHTKCLQTPLYVKVLTIWQPIKTAAFLLTGNHPRFSIMWVLFCKNTSTWFLLSTAKQGDNRIGSVRLSVRLSIRLSVRLFVCLRSRLCRVQKRAKKNHYQSEVFVCVSNNLADAVDRLLIFIYSLLSFIIFSLYFDKIFRLLPVTLKYI